MEPGGLPSVALTGLEVPQNGSVSEVLGNTSAYSNRIRCSCHEQTVDVHDMNTVRSASKEGAVNGRSTEEPRPPRCPHRAWATGVRRAGWRPVTAAACH